MDRNTDTSNTDTQGLVRLDESGLTVASEGDDVRGRTVVDRSGEEIGEVRSLVVDENAAKVRLLEVESGGFLGIGGETRFVPAEAVTRVDEDLVYVDQTREHVHASPAYDPALAEAPDYFVSLYGHYGYGPLWAPGALGAAPGLHGRRAS